MYRIALLAGLLLAATADAGRVPSSRVISPRSPGTAGDITVPYTTNGRSTLGVYHGVAPRIEAYPVLDNSPLPKIQNVYNLPFYGSRLGPSPIGIAATPREPNILRPARR